jgi:hypothetical protein
MSVRKAANVAIPKASPVVVYARIHNGQQVSDWAILGHFWVSSRKESPNLVVLTCHDAMLFASQIYLNLTEHTEWPISMTDAVNEIAEIMGVGIDSRTVIHTETGYHVDYPNEDVLISEVLSGIAAAHGGSWVITPEGLLRLVVFPDTATPVVSIGTKYMDYTPYSRGDKTISRVTINDDAGNQYTSGDDTGLEIATDCSYATNLILANVANSIIGNTFTPYLLTTAYIDPLIEVGDTISIVYRGTTKTLIANSIKLNLQSTPTLSISNGIQDNDEEEVPYISRAELNAKRYISTSKTYYGNKINRSDGFVSELMVDDVPVARMTANADVFKMERYNGTTWSDSIYFDPVTRKYVFTGDVTIIGMITSEDLSTAGRTTINGANITTGHLDASLVSIIGDDNFYWDSDNIYLIDGEDENKQIRIGRFDGTNLGIGFTTDGGVTWTTALNFDGLNTDFSSIEETLTNNYYTKTQTNSQISASASQITSQMAVTYLTKVEGAELEDKISESGQHTYVQLDAPTTQGKGDFWVKANPLKWVTAKDNTWLATKDGTWGDLGGNSSTAAVYVWTGDEWLKTNQQAYVDTLEQEIVQVQSNLDQTAASIRAEVSAVDTKTVTNKTNLETLSATVAQNKADIELTASGLATRVSAVETTTSNLGTTVANNYSEFTQTASSLSSRVESVESGVSTNSSSISQMASEISSKVSAGDIASSINQTAQSVKIQASKIQFEGLVTANNYFKILSDGSIEAVNGKFSGTMTAGYWTFDTSGSVYSNSSISVNTTVLTGGSSMVGGGSDYRAFYGSTGCDVQYGADYNYQAIIRAKNIKIISQVGSVSDYRSAEFKKIDGADDMTLVCGESEGQGYEAGNIGCSDQPWDTLYVRKQYRGTTDSSYSSRTIKKDIEPMPDLGDMLDRLAPVRFRYKWDPPNHALRHGLIYEDTVQIYPAICEAPDSEVPGAPVGSIMYEELIAVMLKEIQLMRGRIATLEGRLSA